MMKHLMLVLSIALLIGNSFTNSAAQEVSSVPASVREKFELDEFYKKYVNLEGMPVVSSEKVSDDALREAVWIVRKMVGHRPEILKAMAANNTRLAIMASTEYTTDIPEHSFLTPQMYWDRRARGLGATRRAPAVSCGEENLLCIPGDPYYTENICIHEFSHAIHEMGMVDIDPTFDKRLKAAYGKAKKEGKWKDTYAMSNHREYWAEASQSWFDHNRENDSLHNHVDTRDELKEYDPDVARLCEEVFGDRGWRYKKPRDRDKVDISHLKNPNFDKLPRFQWRKEEAGNRPKIRIMTSAGDIEVELYAKKAPKTVANFLTYVDQAHYTEGAFFRTVTKKNQPNSEIKIEVIQANANQASKTLFPKPIPLERTRDTGLSHVDGTISMAREGPDSAQNHFFICIGDQKELDFGGKRNPDGQGFAAFGRVTKGMKIVREIQAMKSNDQMLTPPLKIRHILRLE